MPASDEHTHKRRKHNTIFNTNHGPSRQKSYCIMVPRTVIHPEPASTAGSVSRSGSVTRSDLTSFVARRRGNLTSSMREVRAGIGEGNGDFVPRTVIRTQAESNAETSVTRSDLTGTSLMDEVESEDENLTKKDLAQWIRNLQLRLETMELEMQQALSNSVARQNDMIGRTQVQLKRDPRTFRKIHTLVSDKIFSGKKFIISQRDLDDFNPENSLGNIIMGMLKIEKPDRLPFWGCYKEIVADAIANRRTIITNDLKKVVMSKLIQE